MWKSRSGPRNYARFLYVAAEMEAHKAEKVWPQESIKQGSLPDLIWV